MASRMMRELIGAQVALTAPDGEVWRFRCDALLPYAGETYAVLVSGEDEGQVLITRPERQGETMAFIAARETDVVEHVLDKYRQQLIRRAVADLPEDGE